MASNWLMMTSSGDDNWPSGTSSAEVWILLPTKRKKKIKPRAEQETAQPTAARFKKKNKPKVKHDRARLRLRGKKPKAEQETAQPTAARFKNLILFREILAFSGVFK